MKDPKQISHFGVIRAPSEILYKVFVSLEYSDMFDMNFLWQVVIWGEFQLNQNTLNQKSSQ